MPDPTGASAAPPAPKVNAAQREAAKAQMDTIRRKEHARAKRQGRLAPEPPRQFRDGAVVEVRGAAQVDTVDKGERVRTDHQGACGVVVSSYVSDDPSKGRVAQVKCEDGELRGIPEARLRDVTPRPAASAPSRHSMAGIPRERWEAAFGPSRPNPNFLTEAQRKAAGKA